MQNYPMADSTRDMRRSVYKRELEKPFARNKLTESTHEDLRRITGAIVERDASPTAVQAREIVLQVYRWAIERVVLSNRSAFFCPSCQPETRP